LCGAEVRQVFNSWATQTVRLYADQPFLEFEYTIGPIDISDDRGKEVWNTDLVVCAEWNSKH
jgi:hypothetical protein